MRECQETTRHSSLGEGPGRNVNQRTSQRLCTGLLAAAAAAALFIAGCGTSESAEVLVAPQAPAETTAPPPSAPIAEADPVSVPPVSGVEAEPVSVPVSAAEADIDFDASQTCRQEGEIPAEPDNLIAAAATLSEAFPNLSAEGTEGTASPAQVAAFILAGCEVHETALQYMAQDGQIGVETRRLVQAITSENLADFPNIYMESRCLRAGTDHEGQVLSAPHRVRRIVTALRDVWLAVQQPEGAEFEQVMKSVSERLVGDIWAALVVDEGDGDFSLKEQSEAEAAQIKQEIEQTCGYELVRTDAVV